jgi:hypothetical protein
MSASNSSRITDYPTPLGVSPLYRRIAGAARFLRVSRNSLRVMAPQNDPYALDTPVNHRAGQWFADQIERFVRAGRSVHLRGLHYLLASTAIVRPNGSVYVNDIDCWDWLTSTAAKAARWLGYVPFDRIHDARNEEPIWRAGFAGEDFGKPWIERCLRIHRGSVHEIEIPDLDSLLPSPVVSADRRPTQAYRLGLIGEKSSLHPVVEPYAARFGMDVVLDTGDVSDTHLYQMAARAAEDPRPFVCCYLSDFDPSGHNMPTSAARKFQALCDLLFPDLDVRIYAIALTPEQCIKYKLPSAPLKESERRAPQWLARFGREQTEIDALMALHPGELERVLEAAIEPFYDPSLEHRYRQAVATPRHDQEWFDNLPEVRAAVDEIAKLHGAATNAANDLVSSVERHSKTISDAVENADDAPELKPVTIEPKLLGEVPEPLFHSLDDWIVATRKLQERKNGSDDAEGGAA